MLSSMATSFGISTELLDAELSRFIAAGRLNAKIDKVRTTSALLCMCCTTVVAKSTTAVFLVYVTSLCDELVHRYDNIPRCVRGFRGTRFIC
jgi:hypothetical protein